MATHCSQGHPWLTETTAYNEDGSRYCTECIYSTPKEDLLSCANGHKWTLGNTGRSAEGYRYCKGCKRAHTRAYRARKKLDRESA